MAAPRAETVEFELVGGDGEAVAAGDFFLEAFDVAILELDDLPA